MFSTHFFFFFLIRGAPELFSSPEEREIIPCVLELSEEYVLHHLKAGHFFKSAEPWGKSRAVFIMVSPGALFDADDQAFDVEHWKWSGELALVLM